MSKKLNKLASEQEKEKREEEEEREREEKGGKIRERNEEQK